MLKNMVMDMAAGAVVETWTRTKQMPSTPSKMTSTPTKEPTLHKRPSKKTSTPIKAHKT